MNTWMKIAVIFALTLFFLSACDENDPPEGLDTAAALSHYWEYQTDLTGGLHDRNATMDQISAKFLAMGGKGRDAWTEIDALVNTYIAQSEASAEDFDQLIQAENAIIPYGEDKGILSSIAGGIYGVAKSTVVSSGRMVRSGYRVLSGKKSLRQVLNDPESGIPIVSSFAETIAQHNADRDASIRQAILENNNMDGFVPLDQFPGESPQDKMNYYLNLSDESPLKMSTRADVMFWDEEERTRTAATARKLGETGVKTVADAAGGSLAGEVVNEIISQHMEPGQTSADTGTLNLTLNQNATANPPVTSPKTIIIAKANKPADDPRITVIPNAPQALTQPLPEGEYNIIMIADGFVRSIAENLQIVSGQVISKMGELYKLSENAIIIDRMWMDEGLVQINQPVHFHLNALSTIGKNLSFNWQVTGGTYSNLSAQQNHLTFKPTQENEYTVTVTVSDDAKSVKTASMVFSVTGASITVEDYTIQSSTFNDSKLNPGESATLQLELKNNGPGQVSGTQSITTFDGITNSYGTVGITAAENQSWIINVPIVIPPSYSESQAVIQYNLSTLNQNQIPVTITGQVVVPVDFYVEIDQLSSPVTDRVVTITGIVANPQLNNAILIVDNNPDQTFDLNLNSGYFSQDIAMAGSSSEVDHVVKVIAVSGGLTANATMSFSSQVAEAALQATLTWDTDGTDVDFWITDPNGEKCYFGNDYTASGLELDFDDTNGYGPENITATNIIPGDYLVQVHYWSDHDYYNEIVSNCVVVIRQGSESATPVTYYGTLYVEDDVWTVTTLHYDATRGWSFRPNNSYGKVNKANLPAK